MEFRNPSKVEKESRLYKELERAVSRFSIRKNEKMIAHLIDAIDRSESVYKIENGIIKKGSKELKPADVVDILNKRMLEND